MMTPRCPRELRETNLVAEPVQSYGVKTRCGVPAKTSPMGS